MTIHPLEPKIVNGFPYCGNCGETPVRTKGRCASCYRYYWANGRERTPEVRRRKRGDPNPMCSNCKVRPNVAKTLCGRCYGFTRHHGIPWSEEAQAEVQKQRVEKLTGRYPKTLQPCTRCGKECLRFSPGRCSTCQSYWSHNKQERPLDKGKNKPCSNCKTTREPYLRKGRCSLCGKHWRKYGIERATDLLPGESHQSRRAALTHGYRPPRKKQRKKTS